MPEQSILGHPLRHANLQGRLDDGPEPVVIDWGSQPAALSSARNSLFTCAKLGFIDVALDPPSRCPSCLWVMRITDGRAPVDHAVLARRPYEAED